MVVRLKIFVLVKRWQLLHNLHFHGLKEKRNLLKSGDGKNGIQNRHEQQFKYETKPSLMTYGIIWLLIFLQKGCNGSIIVSPTNVAAYLGSEIILRCDTDQDDTRIKWFAVDPLSGKETIIWNGYQLSKVFGDTYEVNNSVPRHCDLIIKEATESSAKRYLCREPLSEQRRMAEVVVIGADPNCSYKKNAENFTIECHVKLYGTWAPTVEWVENVGNHTRTLTQNAVRKVDKNGNVTSRLTVNISNAVHGTTYTVLTKFTNQERQYEEGCAEGVPDYNFIKTITYFSTEVEPQSSVSPGLTRILILLVPLLLTVIFLQLICFFRIKKQSSLYKRNTEKEIQRYIESENNLRLLLSKYDGSVIK